MQAIAAVIGAGGQGAQPGRQMPTLSTSGTPQEKPVAPDAPGQPGWKQAMQSAGTAAGTMKQLEHPAWMLVDKLAGDDRMGFAQNNPGMMNMIKGLFE